MSASKNTSATMKKPFCKVCFDAGKDSAHPLRNAAGQTACPYLLSLICKNCYKKGHTVKYCKEPKRISDRRQPPRVFQPEKKEPTQNKFNSFNALAVLIEEEDNQEETRRIQETERKKNFPQMSTHVVASKKSSDSILTGWSQIAGKPVKVYETLSEEEEEEEQSPQPVQVQQEKAEKLFVNSYSSWADCE